MYPAFLHSEVVRRVAGQRPVSLLDALWAQGAWPGLGRFMRIGCGTAASEMLRAGATLPEVGQVRYRHAWSTAIYAKVGRDRAALPVGLP